ncbi:ribonuclease H-like protein, partial [Rickenella mellea]
MVLSSEADVMIYTDGSGLEGGIGAAAVLMRHGRTSKTLAYHLGPPTRHTVYAGEAVGLLLGTELLRQVPGRFRSVAFCTDNQAAIRAAGLYRPGPGRYVLEWFRDALQLIAKRNGPFTCDIIWTPGHVGIEGNETVDALAKRAARGFTSRKDLLPRQLRTTPLPDSKAALQQASLAKLQTRATRHWKSSPRYTRTTKIDPSLPSKKFLALTTALSRQQS